MSKLHFKNLNESIIFNDLTLGNSRKVQIFFSNLPLSMRKYFIFLGSRDSYNLYMALCMIL